jgi:hypothetical protein
VPNSVAWLVKILTPPLLRNFVFCLSFLCVVVFPSQKAEYYSPTALGFGAADPKLKARMYVALPQLPNRYTKESFILVTSLQTFQAAPVLGQANPANTLVYRNFLSPYFSMRHFHLPKDTHVICFKPGSNFHRTGNNTLEEIAWQGQAAASAPPSPRWGVLLWPPAESGLSNRVRCQA